MQHLRKKTSARTPAKAPAKPGRSQPPAAKTTASLPAGDRAEVASLYNAVRRSGAQIVGPRGTPRPLPDSPLLFLRELAALLQEQPSAMIIRNEASLTTIEAANLLGVSRQFLVNLLTRGEIPCYMVGTHRRIYAQDLLRYKAARDAARHKLLRDLARAEAEEGIYYSAVPSSADAT